MSQIEHVVYLMLENRSFDNVLGWLYDANNPPQHLIAAPGRQAIPFYGLENPEGIVTHYNQFYDSQTHSYSGERHYVRKGTESMSSPDPDPHESYKYVNLQLFGRDVVSGPFNTPPENQPPTMKGFLANYATTHKDLILPITQQEALQMMTTYSPEQLPVINGLAKNYAVSDEWFCSIPTQTNCNRAFSICGTSLGYVNNHGPLFREIPKPFDTATIWNVLTENGFSSTKDWMIYWQDTVLDFVPLIFTKHAFPKIPDPDHHFAKIDEFQNAAEAGKLPAFSYLEPAWYESIFGGNGNSYHPPADVLPGEQMLKKIYDWLTTTDAAQEAWGKTLFIVTFDEHGGTYDHVPPSWGATPPWGKGNPPPEGIVLEDDFEFDRWGVRVPAILSSPWINEQSVFRSLKEGVPYDHTSVIATILSWKGIPKEKWNLGERVANAPSFDNVLNRATPRETIPTLEMGSLTTPLPSAEETPINSLQVDMLPLVLTTASAGKLSPEAIKTVADQILKKSKNLAELQAAIRDFEQKHAS